MEAGAVSLWRREAVFLTAMLVSETGIVGMNTLFKAATSKGLNSYAFLAYSYLLASLLLLPTHFLSDRSRSLPPLSFAILSKIGLLGLLGIQSLPIMEAGAVSLWRREAVFLTAMLVSETGIVGMNTLFKSATSKGLNSYAFLAYSYLLATLFLLPTHFFSNRSRSLPPLSFSILSKIALLGLVGSMYLITGCIGVKYSNPTLSSAMGNITPALTFILAIIFRMEKLNFKEKSSVAKVMGTILSLVGALVVVLYHGPRVFIASSPPYINFGQLSPSLSSSNSDWIIGGCLLTIKDIFVSVSFVLQAHIMTEYPAAFTVSFFYTVCVSIFTSLTGLVVERNNPSIWIIRSDITLITILTYGIFTPVYYVIHSWTVRYKGPFYLAIFKPLSILIAVAMSAIFLGDSLYLGCLIGGVLITLGFYAVTWGKANEDKTRLLSLLQKEKTPLLLNHEDRI